MKAERVSELDLMRFVAAVAVVAFHAVPLLGPHAPAFLMDATRFGHFGVRLFFMISGFVILWTATNKRAYAFLASRVSRLYPSFWVAVLLASAMLVTAADPPSGRQLLANLTMVPTWLHFAAVDGVYWTLAVEIQFYALVWVLILTRQLRYIERWLTAGLALTLVAFCAGAEIHVLRSFSPFFISGACLYLIRSQGPSRWRLTLLSASATLGVYQAITHQANATHLTGAGPTLAAAGLVLLMHGVFLAVALRKLRLRTSAVWYWLGCLTYPLYLLHNVSGRRFFWLLPDTLNIWVRWTVMLVAIFAAAFIFAALIERRACRRFNCFLNRVAQSVAASVSPVCRRERKLTTNN